MILQQILRLWNNSFELISMGFTRELIKLKSFTTTMEISAILLTMINKWKLLKNNIKLLAKQAKKILKLVRRRLNSTKSKIS